MPLVLITSFFLKASFAMPDLASLCYLMVSDNPVLFSFKNFIYLCETHLNIRQWAVVTDIINARHLRIY